MNSQRLSLLFLLAGTAVGQTISLTPQDANHASPPAARSAAWPPVQQQRPPQADGPLGAELARRAPAPAFEEVLHDDPGTGVLWACGADWKASFGADGFTFVPFLGAEAPRNFPAHFRIVSVQVGGREVPFVADSKPARTGDRITFDRGALREVYDLSLTHVEQTFVLDTALAGDVEIQVAVDSELAQDPQGPGLQFGNAFGAVRYGAAFSVRGPEKLAIESAWDGRTIRLRVPASLRGAGPVVVDPIISTLPTGYQPLRTHRNPDIAYDASWDTYLAVWDSPASATDTDVFSEMFDGNGKRIVGSGRAVDLSTLAWSGPRVADSDWGNRFLVVAQRVDTQGHATVYARTRDADGPGQFNAEFRVSSASYTGDHIAPEVGGDSGFGGLFHWLVVWTYVSGSTSTIHGQLLDPHGKPYFQSDFVIATDPTQRVFAPQVSHTNTGNLSGAGLYWFVVYTKEASPGGEADVWGREVSVSGQMSPPAPIATGLADDRYPHVSSPATDRTGAFTYFLVTFEQQRPFAAHAIIYNATNDSTIAATNLSQKFGFGLYWVRAESDGIRFVVTANVSTNINSLAVATLAFDGLRLVLHDGPRVLQGIADTPKIASKYSGGGLATDYAIAYIDSALTPPRTRVTFYAGYVPGTQIAQHSTACNGLDLQWSGLPLLGGAMRFTLANLGGDLPGFLVGFPIASPMPLCSTCSLGVRPDRPIFTTFGSTTLDLPIPKDIGLVGATLAIQGLSIGRSTCLGSASLSDTFDITAR